MIPILTEFKEGFAIPFCCNKIFIINEVVSWKISKRNDNELVIDTIELFGKKEMWRWNHFQFRSGGSSTHLMPTTNELLDLGIIGSHSRKGDLPYNACIEVIFSPF